MCEFIPSPNHADSCKSCGKSFFDHAERRGKVGRKRKLSAEQESQVVQWWLARVSVKEKARELGISGATLQNILDRHGVIK